MIAYLETVGGWVVVYKPIDDGWISPAQGELYASASVWLVVPCETELVRQPKYRRRREPGRKPKSGDDVRGDLHHPMRVSLRPPAVAVEAALENRDTSLAIAPTAPGT
jgi:hypothetical protein